MFGFQVAELEDAVAVGATDHQSARIWVRSAIAGAHVLELWSSEKPGRLHALRFQVGEDPEADNTTCLVYPRQGHEPLAPATPYEFRVLREQGGKLVGEGSFETAPEDGQRVPERFSFGVMSCHQPFDDQGSVRPESLHLLQALPEAFAAHATKRVLLVGDQMYADYPPVRSLFDPDYFAKVGPRGRASVLDCSPAEVRRLYHQRYRLFWSQSAFRHLQSHYASYPMWDDHEIVDNFGANREHWTARWDNLRAGAFAAFDDYQGCRVRTPDPNVPSKHYSFEYGPVATFVMDLRSEKRWVGSELQLCSDYQLTALAAFLQRNAAKRAIVVVISVPLVHIPDWLATLGARVTGEGSDAADRWSFKEATGCRTRLLRLLRGHRKEHPGQKLVLVGGDIHSGVVSRLSWPEDGLDMLQFVSSAVSNLQNPLQRICAEFLPRMSSAWKSPNCPELPELELLPGAGKNPYGGLNAGILEFETAGAEIALRLKLVSHAPESSTPRVVFESEPL